MSITAVPLQPIAKGSLRTLWLGLAAVALTAGGLAYWTTADVRVKYESNVDWLADNATATGVMTTKSGLQYRIIREGEGKTIAQGQVAIINYKGTLRDGTPFEASDNFPILAGGGQTVPGFEEAILMMKKGGKAEFWIPSELGYGEEAKADPRTGKVAIPANSILHFDIDLTDVMDRATFDKQMQQMQQQMGGAGGPPPQGQPQEM